MGLFILIIVGFAFALWLSTLTWFTPKQGQTSILTYFDKHTQVVGIGIPKVTIRKEIIPKDLWPTLLETDEKTVKIRAEDRKSALRWRIFPQGIYSFDYKIKKFKTLKEVKDTGGKPRWEPTIPKDKDGKPIKKENDPETMVLGEWTEKKKAIFVRERDEVGFKFISGDGVKGIAKAYMKYIIWDMSLATSSVHNFKDDPEKAAIDLFSSYAKDKVFTKDIQGFSFEKYAGRDSFLKETNNDIWMTGVLLEDIQFEEFFLEPESENMLQEQEKIQIEKIRQETARAKIETEKLLGEADAANKREKAQGEADSIRTIADAEQERIKKTGAAQNEVTSELDKKLKANEVAQYKEKKDIDVKVNGQIFDKMIEYKGVIDKTEVDKFYYLGKTTGTIIIHEANSKNSSLDDIVIEGQLVANNITKKGGA